MFPSPYNIKSQSVISLNLGLERPYHQQTMFNPGDIEDSTADTSIAHRASFPGYTQFRLQWLLGWDDPSIYRILLEAFIAQNRDLSELQAYFPADYILIQVLIFIF